MAEDKPEVDEAQTKTKFQSWVNEVLDQREQAATEKAQAEKDAADADAAKRRTKEPLAMIRAFLGM